MYNPRSLITDNYYYPPYSWGTHHKSLWGPERARRGSKDSSSSEYKSFQQFTGRVYVWPTRRTFGTVFTDSYFKIYLAPNAFSVAFLKLKQSLWLPGDILFVVLVDYSLSQIHLLYYYHHVSATQLETNQSAKSLECTLILNSFTLYWECWVRCEAHTRNSVFRLVLFIIKSNVTRVSYVRTSNKNTIHTNNWLTITLSSLTTCAI